MIDLRFWRKSVRAKVILLFMVLSIVPALLISYFVYENSRKTLENHVIQHLTTVVALKEQAINQWFEEGEKRIRGTAASPYLVENYAYLSQQTGQTSSTVPYDKVKDFLEGELSESYFFELFLMTSEGRIVISTDSEQEGKNKSNRPYFTEGKEGTFVQNVYHSLTLGEPALTMSAPVRDGSGRLVGVLAGRVTLGGLGKIMGQYSGLGETGDTYIVNKYNFFVTEPRFGGGYALKKAVHTEGVKECLEHKSGVGLYSNYRERPVLGSYAWIEEREFGLLAEMEQSEAFAPIHSLRLSVLLFGVSVVSAATALGLVFSTRLTNPVRELAIGTARVGKGDLAHRVRVASEDELGQLANSFNKMAEDLWHTTVSKDYVDSIIGNMLDALFVADPDGTIRTVNKAACKLTLHKEEELIGKPIDAVLTEEAPLNGTILEQLIELGELADYETECSSKDGRRILVLLNGSVIRDKDGNMTSLVCTVRDISERKRAEQERRELEQKAHMASRLASVGEMAAGIAHEINNPLTGVIGFAQLLMKKDVPDDVREDLKIINDGAERVASIVKRLLSFAHQHRPERDYIDINEIMETTLALRSYALKTSNIQVTTRLDPGLPRTMADGSQLQQVFLNIIINAETEMKLAHGRGNLLIKTETIDNTIRISFADDGPGIANENLQKMFDPFFTTKEVGQGTGLGLSVCLGIVAEHGGKIYAESEPGKGATFIVELPVVCKPEESESAEPVDEVENVASKKILVVDDEAAIRRFLDELLTAEGHKVETVDNAGAALDRLKSGRYSLILLDIKLPGMSGIELYKQIQRIARSLAKRVVFITGDVMGPDTKKFLSRTKAPYIAKPFDIKGLKKEINHILTRDLER